MNMDPLYPAPFQDGPGILRFLQGTMRRKRDFMVCSEGPEGAGKSTTTGNLCRALNPDFNVVQDTIMDLDHLLQVLAEGRRDWVYDLDEAINIFHNQDWATWEAKHLSRIIRQMRIMRCVWVLNVPDFEGLHPYLRDYRIRLRLYHQPVYDADGMGNEPPHVLWKSEWFSYKQQRVVHRWSDLFELEVDSLDDDPDWKGYEDKKEANFHRLVDEMRKRRVLELAKASRKGKPGRPKKADQVNPPTTT